jgi:hypothetical protein
MPENKEHTPFTYQRGRLRITGRTDSDRKSARIDNICYWIYKFILALGFLLTIFYKLISLA